ncbi:MAG: hypothetical protein QOG15_3176 [Solirubrobacteraceae bacterium]|jgi:SAM-dependent methyltransferase|nr:hypothetical protein [Solirubrobacteraceae bacterium]
MNLEGHQRDWEELAQLDPLWAILSAPGTRLGGWQLDEFLATGRPDVERLMSRAAQFKRPEHRRRALDFGCGVGRHAQLLAEHFDEVVGVDVSEEMVRLARRFGAGVDGLEFVVNCGPRLAGFGDGEFDLVHSVLVLQHLPGEEAILGYIGELARVLSPGGLLFFQVPVAANRRRRLEGRRRLYGALRRTGLSADILYRRLGLNPVRMSSAAPERIDACLREAGVDVLAIDPMPVGEGYDSRAWWAGR